MASPDIASSETPRTRAFCARASGAGGRCDSARAHCQNISLFSDAQRMCAQSRLREESQRLLAISLHAPFLRQRLFSITIQTSWKCANIHATCNATCNAICNAIYNAICNVICNAIHGCWFTARHRVPTSEPFVSVWHLLQHKLLEICCNSPLAEPGDVVPWAELCDVSLAGDVSFMAADYILTHNLPRPCRC